jgi:Lipocalin-like domain
VQSEGASASFHKEDSMKSFGVKTMLATALITVLVTGQAAAQTANDLIGWWTAVSIANETDGKKIDLFGSNPKGYAVFDGKGHFAFAYTRPDLPKFASSNRSSGTASENEAIVHGSLSYFGTYTYNEAE